MVFQQSQSLGETGVGVDLASANDKQAKACLNSASAGPQGETPQGVS
ncbi:hypothetical protein [Limnobaculum parvum]|nr:hypothetical protein [Limnobaculum parvum]